MAKEHPLDKALKPIDGIFASALKKAMDATGPGVGQVQLSKGEARQRFAAEWALKTPEQKQQELSVPGRAMEIMELLEKRDS